jgi:hypothetical protein
MILLIRCVECTHAIHALLRAGRADPSRAGARAARRLHELAFREHSARFASQFAEMEDSFPRGKAAVPADAAASGGASSRHREDNLFGTGAREKRQSSERSKSTKSRSSSKSKEEKLRKTKDPFVETVETGAPSAKRADELTAKVGWRSHQHADYSIASCVVYASLSHYLSHMGS